MWDTFHVMCTNAFCPIHVATPPAECLQTPKGIDYFGSTAVTETGITCQRWDKQEPHQHKFWALVDQDNYCRNPDGDSRPWCYTIDPDIEFDYCKISYCGM